MKCGKVLIRLHVDPVADYFLLLWGSLLLVWDCSSPDVLEDDLERIGIIYVSTVRQETEVERIFHDCQVERLIRHHLMLNQALVVLVVDELEDLLGGYVTDLCSRQDFVFIKLRV